MQSRLIRVLLIIAMAILMPLCATGDIQALSKKDKHLLVRSILYWPEGVSCFVHETGHALAARAMIASPISIHIGSYFEELTKEKQRTEGKKLGITVNGFDFSKGYCWYGSTKNKKNSQRIINLAGPLAGIASCLAMKKLMSTIKPTTLPGMLLVEASNYLIEYEMLHQAIYGLTPFYQSDGNDGYRFWQSFNLSTDTLQKIKSFDRGRRIKATCFRLLGAKALYIVYKKMVHSKIAGKDAL